MSTTLINDIKTYLMMLFNKPVDDYDFLDFRVYSKFYKAFADMFDYTTTDIIIDINKFKKTTSSNIITLEMINKFEMMHIIPAIIPDTTKININNFKPLH